MPLALTNCSRLVWTNRPVKEGQNYTPSRTILEIRWHPPVSGTEETASLSSSPNQIGGYTKKFQGRKEFNPSRRRDQLPEGTVIEITKILQRKIHRILNSNSNPIRAGTVMSWTDILPAQLNEYWDLKKVTPSYFVKSPLNRSSSKL